MKKIFYLSALLFCSLAFAEPEKYYVEKYCQGEIEVLLEDSTRVDCLTDYHAIEFDFSSKWAESIGQSLYYAAMTGKKPAVFLICDKPHLCERHVNRFVKATKHYKIDLYTIRMKAK